MFIISNPDLVIAQCRAGIIGSFPALNAREAEGEPPLLDVWLRGTCWAPDRLITGTLVRHSEMRVSMGFDNGARTAFRSQRI